MKQARHTGAQAHTRAHRRAPKHKYTHGRAAGEQHPHAHEQAHPPTRAPRPLARAHNKPASLADEWESKRSRAQHPHAFAFHEFIHHDLYLRGKNKRGMREAIGNPNPTFSAVVLNSDDGDGVASPESSRRPPLAASPPPPSRSGGGSPGAESTKTRVGGERKSKPQQRVRRTANMRPRLLRWKAGF